MSTANGGFSRFWRRGFGDPMNAGQPRRTRRAGRPRLGRRMVVFALGAALAIVGPAAARHARAARLLLELTERTRADALPGPDLVLRVGNLDVRAHEYLPAERNPPALLLLHGAHPRGIDEARLVAFARALASAGVRVLTPELPELMAYRIDANTTDRIAALARLQAERAGVAAVGVVGISFAGGLALIAAANAPAASAIAFVVCVGAHHDLMRLTRYYAGRAVFGPHGEATQVTPHPYGARVMLREHLERFFSAQDLALARSTLDTYLHDEHALAQKQARGLSPAGRQVMRVLLSSRQSAQLDRMLLRAADEARTQLALASPRGRLARLTAPVFLVHGADDPIVPSIETLWLAAELPRRVRRELLITAALRHAELGKRASAHDDWQLVHFMADVLAATDAERFRHPRTDHAH